MSQTEKNGFNLGDIISDVKKTFKRRDEKGLTTEKVRSVGDFLDSIDRGEISTEKSEKNIETRE